MSVKPKLPTRLLTVHFACNDPDNGDFIRRACGIHFDFGRGEGIDLDGAEVAFNHVADPSRFRLSRSLYAYEGQTTWIGNWCWNAYHLQPIVAAKLVQDLMRNGVWSLNGGPSEACEAWDASDLHGFMRLWTRSAHPRPQSPILASGK